MSVSRWNVNFITLSLWGECCWWWFWCWWFKLICWILTCNLVMVLVVFACIKDVGVYVGDLLYELMHCCVICSCIHKCSEAMFRCDIYDTISYQEAMFSGDDLDDDRYHMHIESCLGALHNSTSVILAFVLNE